VRTSNDAPNEPGEVVVATFRLAPDVVAGSVCVVGEFNDWSHTATPMDRDEEGFVARVALRTGRAYRFRYLIDGERWENDWAADAYVPNEFGGDDSVIDLTGAHQIPPGSAPPLVKAEAPGDPRSAAANEQPKEKSMDRNEPDAVAFLTEQHNLARSLLTEFASGKGDRKATFETLVRVLAVHETAEEVVVYPAVRSAVPNGDALADACLDEESQAKKMLSDLEKLGVDDAEFDTKFAAFAKAVNAHAEHEETEVFPALGQYLDERELTRLGDALVAAEAVAPTHPHPHGPESAAGNVVLGPFVAIADRVRDAVRSMRS
jgi:hemerythrin superfamily protein